MIIDTSEEPRAAPPPIKSFPISDAVGELWADIGKHDYALQEVIDRHPSRFATLLGRRINYGWRESGPSTQLDEAVDASWEMGRHAYD